MVCSKVVTPSVLCSLGHSLHHPTPGCARFAPAVSPSSFLGVLTWQDLDSRHWQHVQGGSAMRHERTGPPGCSQRSVRAEAGAGARAADMPAEGGGVSPLAAVASPSGAAPAVEAGSRAGRRGRSGARSKEKRRLVLLRHAKSSFADLSLRDHERPLDEAGRESAREVATKLKSAGWLPKLVLCSDSLRTRETLAVMQSVVGELAEAETRFLGSYYTKSQLDGQTAQHLRETICKYAADALATVMCMGHNRGWEEAASDFTGLQLELKTANAALLETTGDSWEDAFEHAHKGGWKLCDLLTPDPAG